MNSSADLLGPLGEGKLSGGKRVALYFGASWCPMCRRFEPSMITFREAAELAGKPIELIYVPSEGNENDAKASAKRLGMPLVSQEKAAELKSQFRVWSGREAWEFGTDRRSGVPALVVLGDENLEEIQFLPAEAKGSKVLSEWSDGSVWPELNSS